MPDCPAQCEPEPDDDYEIRASAIRHLTEAVRLLDQLGEDRAAIAAHHALALIDPSAGQLIGVE